MSLRGRKIPQLLLPYDVTTQVLIRADALMLLILLFFKKEKRFFYLFVCSGGAGKLHFRLLDSSTVKSVTRVLNC